MFTNQRRRQWLRRTSGLIVSGGTYDNLANFPSAANRPQLSGSTLSWIGPVGGGPSTSSDVAQTRALSASGSITTTSNGQVIEGKKFNPGASIDIAHDNVTIRQNAFDVSATTGYIMAIKKASCTGLIIEDNYLQGNKNTYEGIYTYSGSSFVSTTASAVRRNYLTGLDNHMTLWCPGNFNMTISDNFFTASGNAGSGSSWDGDQIELYECDHVTISHNVFDGSNAQASGTFNSMVNLSNLGALTNIAVSGNLFANCSTINAFVVCIGAYFSAGSVTYSFTNNGFYLLSGKSYIRSQSGDSGARPTPSPNTGNYTAASMTATSGTLINSGTGAI